MTCIIENQNIESYDTRAEFSGSRDSETIKNYFEIHRWVVEIV